jgi:dTDP-4-dehydrorhamnose reductase
VDRVLVAGIESVVGANLAAILSEGSQPIGLSFSSPVSLACCETAICPSDDADGIREWIENTSPSQIAFCGIAARSSWQDGSLQVNRGESEDSQALKNWATAARDADCRLTYISTDAVFTGPWMFHGEDGTCQCDSKQAIARRNAEKLVLQTAPDALVIRTNVYGWAAQSTGPGWIEQTLSDLEMDCAGPFDYLRHATPILASDFASILIKAWNAGLTGVYHIAGAERVNPNQFVERLADEFDLYGPSPVNGNCLTERPKGFGTGECSLHTNRIRNVLQVAMPTVADGLRRLREQKLSGYCDRLASVGTPIHEKVA